MSPDIHCICNESPALAHPSHVHFLQLDYFIWKKVHIKSEEFWRINKGFSNGWPECVLWIENGIYISVSWIPIWTKSTYFIWAAILAFDDNIRSQTMHLNVCCLVSKCRLVWKRCDAFDNNIRPHIRQGYFCDSSECLVARWRWNSHNDRNWYFLSDKECSLNKSHM